MVRIEKFAFRARELNLHKMAENTDNEINLNFSKAKPKNVQNADNDPRKELAQDFINSCTGLSQKTKDYLLNDELFLNNITALVGSLMKTGEPDKKLQDNLLAYMKTIQGWQDGQSIIKEHQIDTYGYTNDLHRYESITLTKVTLESGQKAYQAEDGTLYGLSDNGDVDFNNRIDTEQQYTPQTNEAPVIGNNVAYLNEDGTSFEFDLGAHTIKQYNSEGNVIFARNMTPDEVKLSPDELAVRLQTAQPTKVQSENEVKNESPGDERRIETKGISGTYQIIDKDNEYEVIMNFTAVNLSGNQAYEAFRSGFNYTPDKDGVYNFRGIKSKNINIIRSRIDHEAPIVAMNAAIYNDLKAKEASGETLTQGEQQFIKDFVDLIGRYGLQVNKNGELEDKS